MLTLLTSMATRSLLADLIPRYQQRTGQAVQVTAMGGVDAVAAVQGGQTYDVVLLSDAAIRQLITGGWLDPGSHLPIVNSPVAVAVPEQGPAVDLRSADTLRTALAKFAHIGLSTGPSGQVLSRQFAAWGLDQPEGRLVIAPPGVAVASLVAQGKAQIGFQQLSEMLNTPGIRVLGLLPDDIQTITTFSAARPVASQHAEAAQALCHFLVAPEHHTRLREHGLEPASP